MKYLILTLLLTGCTSMSLNSQIMPDGTEKVIVGMADRGVFSPSEVRHYEYVCTGEKEARVCKSVSINTVASQDGVAGEWGAAAIHGGSIVGAGVLAIDAASKIGRGLSQSGDVVNNSVSTKSGAVAIVKSHNSGRR